ncbi:sulfotransferase [Desulfogranum marinum]|uniref:sulfotransferase n=1 Tax=Desulfogranum marinum TaxID=453220 RepID=UPI001965512B|nr:sulfotransferase [Desulfogranum marinum]MBM9513975.1 sulfotransferase [Desulfogranum marinum]
MVNVEKIRMVYLTSVEHSGSTLIACLLGGHPQVMTVGEFGTPFPKNGNCSCGAIYQDCAFWQKWAELAEQNSVPFELGNFDINILPDPAGGFWEDLFYYQFPLKIVDRIRDTLYLLLPQRNKAAQAKIDRSVRLAKILCDAAGASVFLDTTKNPLQAGFLAQHQQVDLKVICLVRDGRGVMNSLLTKERTYTPESAVDSWLWGIRNMERAQRHYVGSSQVYFLKLEELCQQPELKLTELLKFVGVEVDDVEFDYSQAKRHIVGNRMRHFFDGTIKKPDEAWRSELSKENLALFEAKAGRINRKYGY